MLSKVSSTAVEANVLAEIEKNERKFIEAVLSRNLDNTSAFLHEAFVYVRENGQIITKQEFLTDYLPTEWIDARLDSREEPRQFGDLVTTVGLGYFRMKGERAYPNTAVTHLWVRTDGGSWVLAHRQESHKGNAIGPLLPQEGGVNNSDNVGAKPTLDVAKQITENELAWLKAMVDNDAESMLGLLHPSLQYVHVTDHTSTHADFMYELSTGFTGSSFRGTTMRQFGDTVVCLHLANYLHLNGPVQSNSQAMHCWAKIDGAWLLVARHATRFLPY